jgi:hypothetical protein
MAVPAGAYAGRVVGYTGVSGYSTRSGLNALFGLNTLERGVDPEPESTDTVNVKFGDQGVGPGETVGRFTDLGTSKSLLVSMDGCITLRTDRLVGGGGGGCGPGD